MLRLSILTSLFLLAGCTSTDAARPDAGLDASTLTDAALNADTSVADGFANDVPVTPSDASLADGFANDVPVAPSDAEAPDAEVSGNPCEGAGGACVDDALFCSDTLRGQVTRIACGPEGGICCLPISPTCENVGTRSEGWYRGDARDCWGECDGLEVRADYCGTATEGWYTSNGSGCDARTGLIALDPFACGVPPRI